MNRFLKAENILHSLLIFIPVAAILHYAKLVDPVWIFFTSGLAIIPLAGLLCNATERLADKVGQGLGGFLNATFGNAPELIISAMALREGLFDVVKASLTGSIIGNILLVFGTSALVGGCRHSVLYFNRTAATTGTTMLALSAIGLLLPATFNYVVRDTTAVLEQKLSLYISIVLLSTYILNLLFALKTHKHLYAGMTDSDSPEAQILENAETDLPEENKDWIGRSAWTAGALLAVSAFLIAWMSESGGVSRRRGRADGNESGFHRRHLRRRYRQCRRTFHGYRHGHEKQDGHRHQYHRGIIHPDRPVRGATAYPAQLFHRPGSNGSAVFHSGSHRRGPFRCCHVPDIPRRRRQLAGRGAADRRLSDAGHYALFPALR